MADEWARFVAGGMVLQRIFSSIGDTIKKAADAAKNRQGEWDKANNVWRSDRMRQMTGAAALRLSGASEETIASVQGRMDNLKASGRDVSTDFAGIAKMYAQRGLQGNDLDAALKRAVEALGKRGHLEGFADSYAALAGGKGVASGVDLTDLATGLVKRMFGMQDDQARALREGIAGGTVGVDANGMVKSLGDASAELAAAIKAVNGAGGLSLAAQGKPGDLNGRDPNHLGYAYSERAAQDGGLDWVDPGNNPGLGDRPDGAATGADYVSAAFDSPVVQAAIAAAMIKGMDVALSSALFKNMLTKTLPTSAAPAATAAAAATGGAAAGGWMATVAALAARLSVVASVVATSGDTKAATSTPDEIRDSAERAAKNPELRAAYTKMSLRGDDRAAAILEAMHAILVEQTKLMRADQAKQRGALVPAQRGQ
jgi:hypothetical protein